MEKCYFLQSGINSNYYIQFVIFILPFILLSLDYNSQNKMITVYNNYICKGKLHKITNQ